MPEMVTIKYDDLAAAFDFVSFAAPFEHRAFVSLDTGAIHWLSETSPIDEEDLPDDLETSDRIRSIHRDSAQERSRPGEQSRASVCGRAVAASVRECRDLLSPPGSLRAFQRTSRGGTLSRQVVCIRGRVYRASAAGLVRSEPDPPCGKGQSTIGLTGLAAAGGPGPAPPRLKPDVGWKKTTTTRKDE